MCVCVCVRLAMLRYIQQKETKKRSGLMNMFNKLKTKVNKSGSRGPPPTVTVTS